MFDKILGNQFSINKLRNFIQVGYNPSCMLFSGPRGLGKVTVALEFARLANCTGDKSVGCNCFSCNQFRQGVSPNLRFFNMRIGKPELRNICGIASTRVQYGKAFIIFRTEDVQEAYQDMLLKALEEPVENVHFILASSYKRPKSPIVSRSVNLSFNYISTQDLFKFLQSNKFLLGKIQQYDPKDVKILLMASEGVPGRLITLMADPYIKTYISLTKQFFNPESRASFISQVDGLFKNNSLKTFCLFLKSVLKSSLRDRISMGVDFEILRSVLDRFEVGNRWSLPTIFIDMWGGV